MVWVYDMYFSEGCIYLKEGSICLGVSKYGVYLLMQASHAKSKSPCNDIFKRIWAWDEFWFEGFSPYRFGTWICNDVSISKTWMDLYDFYFFHPPLEFKLSCWDFILDLIIRLGLATTPILQYFAQYHNDSHITIFIDHGTFGNQTILE